MQQTNAKEPIKKQKPKRQTLFSSGILSNSAKKNNEYFGGDSTVVSGGEEDEDETETETEKDSGKQNSKKR